ncbi:MAG: VirB8/TrbF family protein (plasmid) [Candidatus Symbiodolus clandestinus]
MKKSSPSHETLLAGFNWEISRIQLIEKSEKRAWIVALVASFLAISAWIVIILLLPLKQTIPYVIRVDSTTGVPDIITTLKSKEVSLDEAVNKYWLAQYVRCRETYDWNTLQKDYDTVKLLSSKAVDQEYSSLFIGKQALDLKYKNNIKISIEIISIVPGNDCGTVRFLKKMQKVNEENSVTSKWVATIAYEYLNPSSLNEKDRLINPFGFQVLSYRIDPELLSDK